MIAHVQGTVARRDADAVVVDVHGVGWLVHVPDISDVPPAGQPVMLHTTMQVREDAMDLYGSTNPAAMRLFDLLLRASGVGPKLAMACLRTHTPDVLRTALATGDQTVLTDVPGIGRKVAQRLVLELGDKVGGASTADLAGHGESSVPLQEAREALAALGYTDGEAAAALRGAPEGLTVEQLVTHVLRQADT